MLCAESLESPRSELAAPRRAVPLRSTLRVKKRYPSIGSMTRPDIAKCSSLRALHVVRKGFAVARTKTIAQYLRSSKDLADIFKDVRKYERDSK